MTLKRALFLSNYFSDRPIHTGIEEVCATICKENLTVDGNKYSAHLVGTLDVASDKTTGDGKIS